MRTNEFAKISKLVDTITTRYQEIRKDCGIPNDGWHNRTIERMATPFIKGYFTLAIVEKVSSGKSTFINALLGCKDLLPTGHDQTTCGIPTVPTVVSTISMKAARNHATPVATAARSSPPSCR